MEHQNMARFYMLALFGKCRKGQRGPFRPRGLQTLSEPSGTIAVQ